MPATSSIPTPTAPLETRRDLIQAGAAGLAAIFTTAQEVGVTGGKAIA
jgi:hypothetical protein